MDKIAIFYHINQINNWDKLFEEQIITLQQSGLYDAASHIHFGVNGNFPLPYNLIKVNSTKRNNRLDLESDTLFDLFKFANENIDFKIVYIHQKGITWQSDSTSSASPYYRLKYYDNVVLWRKYLEYFVIKRWKECTELLDKYDCVGTEWDDLADIANEKEIHMPHYAGNFWWANASYINKLDPNFLYVDNGRTRFQGEFWIGTGNPNYYNYFSSQRCKYMHPILPEEYENISIEMR